MADYYILLKSYNFTTRLYDIKAVKIKTLNTARKYSIMWQKENACGPYIYKDPEGIAIHGSVTNQHKTNYVYTQGGYKERTTTQWYWNGLKESYRINTDGTKDKLIRR